MDPDLLIWVKQPSYYQGEKKNTCIAKVNPVSKYNKCWYKTALTINCTLQPENVHLNP